MKAPSPSRPQRQIGKAANAPRSARKFPWPKAEDALLGKLTDREVAEKLNRTLSGVRGRRKFLGKSAAGRVPQPFRIEREPRDRYARLFATKSNQELRAMLGWSYKRIHTRRRQLASGKVSKQQPEWTLEEDRLLGTKPDQVLAREFGRPVSAVRHRRGKKRIRLKKDWRPEDDQVLGTRPDHEIALLLGRSVTNVAWRRNKLGIPPKTKARLWTPEEESLLGVKPDREVARQLGRTFFAVQARRIQLKRPKAGGVFRVVKAPRSSDNPGRTSRAKLKAIYKVVKVIASKAHRETPAPAVNMQAGAAYCTWTAEEDALLGKFTDEVVARKLGYPVTRVRRRRRLLGLWNPNPNHRHWTKEEIALLGTQPDRAVATLVNRTLGNVRMKRLELGIPFHNPRYDIWKPDELALLGKISDDEVARRTGHSLTSVRQARAKRHILSVRRAASPADSRPGEATRSKTAPDA